MFSVDHRFALLEALYHAVKNRRVAGYISETVETLEAIRRTTRGDYLAAERLCVISKDTSGVNGGLRRLVTIRAAHSLHPGLPGILTDMLQEAFGMDFRLLACSRGVLQQEHRRFVLGEAIPATQLQKIPLADARRVEVIMDGAPNAQ